MVILPFADYTPADSPNDYWRRNIEIMEALQDEMLRFGYRPAISEDVFSYLSEKKLFIVRKGPRSGRRPMPCSRRSWLKTGQIR